MCLETVLASGHYEENKKIKIKNGTTLRPSLQVATMKKPRHLHRQTQTDTERQRQTQTYTGRHRHIERKSAGNGRLSSTPDKKFKYKRNKNKNNQAIGTYPQRPIKHSNKNNIK
jgi:hypothetical protein